MKHYLPPRRGMRFLIIALTSALAVPVAAGAQPVDSFRGLAELVDIGKSAVVTTRDGDVIVGQVVDASPTALSVYANGSRIELDEARVVRVRQDWADPTRDGAAKGFAAVAGPLLALYVYAAAAEGGGGDGGVGFAGLALGVGAFGLAGALVGATIDRNRTRMTDLYRSPEGGPRATIAPLSPRGGAGAVLSIRW